MLIFLLLLGLHDISKNYRSRDNSICDIRIAASCDKCNLLCQDLCVACIGCPNFTNQMGLAALLSLYPPPSS